MCLKNKSFSLQNVCTGKRRAEMFLPSKKRAEVTFNAANVIYSMGVTVV